MTSWTPDSWAEWAALFAVASAVLGALYFLLRAKLGSDFVPRTELMKLHEANVQAIGELHADHGKLIHRVASVEQTLVALPTRVDLRRTEDQVAELAMNVGKMSGSMEGLERAVDRVCNQMNLLVRAQMEKDKP